MIYQGQPLINDDLMDELIDLKDLTTRLDDHIDLLETIGPTNLEDLGIINHALRRFMLSINSKSLIAEGEEMRRINALFTRLNRVGAVKAKKYKLVYNKSNIVFNKRKGKRVKIKVLVAEGGTQTREAPVSREVHPAAVLLRTAPTRTASTSTTDEVESQKDLNAKLKAVVSERTDSFSIKYWIDKGADVNCEGESETPLAIASRRNNQANLNTLLELKADVNVRDRDGETPLMSTIDSNFGSLRLSKDCADILLAHGADINAKNKSGETILDIARATEKRLESDRGREGLNGYIRFLEANGAKTGREISG